MADAIIDRLSPSDTETIAHLYNSVFRPVHEPDWFERRLRGRHNPLIQVARIGADAVGFYIGLELKPSTHCGWLLGVVSDHRRAGIGTQLMRSAVDWSRTEGYRFMRFEVPNAVRHFLHFGIAEGFDIVGLRWDSDLMTNLVIFEKSLREPGHDDDHHHD
jgi:GNAT superfamily N-acetyltransferase